MSEVTLPGIENFDPDTEFQIKFELGIGIMDQLKKILHKPFVKEGIIIVSIILFKTGLWYAYRKADMEGLEIVDL